MLNSQNKTILVFSDPHLEIDKVNKILSTEIYDIAVCLGDWFDNFYYDSEEHHARTCDFLKKWLFQSNFYTCIGNHDIHYLYDNKHTICGGFKTNKKNLIRKHFSNNIDAIRDKFLWYIWIDNYLCSHAGLNIHHLSPIMALNKQSISTWLNKQINYAELKLKTNGRHWLYGAGEARHGTEKIGGIIWQDFDYELDPIGGLDQIVGHTYHPSIVTDNSPDSKNIDIDCNLNQYLIIKNGKVEIKSFVDL